MASERLQVALVNALQEALGKCIVCFVTLDDNDDIHIVCPSEEAEARIALLTTIDWREAFSRLFGEKTPS